MNILIEQNASWAKVSDRLRGPRVVPVARVPSNLRDKYVTSQEVAELRAEIAELAEMAGVNISTLSMGLLEARQQIAKLEAALDENKALAIPAPMAWKRILIEVAKASGTTVAELISPRRTRHISEARQAAMYRLSRETSMSIPQIGRRLGGRDHSSILHGIRRHEERMRQQA